MKQEAFIKIQNLVNRFSKYEEQFTSKEYKEASLRMDFLDNFFEAFGWKVGSINGINPLDQEVIIEESLETEKTTKYIDYTFKINRNVQFIVEAKKPSENLRSRSHIFQAKSYGFTMEVPFVILTNFKDLLFYDISTEPFYNQPDTDIVNEYSMHYSEYLDNFDLLWNMFSREAVVNGSLSKLYAKRRKLNYDPNIIFKLNYDVKKGSSLLDEAFLRDLRKWRKLLAQDIYENNSFQIEAINEVVQRILDRLIFIRIIEDREIERSEYLKEILDNYNAGKIASIKSELDILSKELNKKFNGLIFHNHDLSNEAIISDEVLIKLINQLYYPNSPYNFKIIKPEILGRIFELYLGEKLVLNGSVIELELKEAEKKSGGVYYTPSNIVKKIVEKSLGGKLKNRSIGEVEDFSIADISCGSGSFLIGAYKYMIEFYEGYYASLSEAERVQAINQGLVFEENNRLKLTMEFKKDILTNNLFGVDIDAQAIEVAKLSLYITMLEDGYRENTIRPILPDLNDNIKHGNSIVAYDIMHESNFEVDINKVNPFDWHSAFEEVFENGGFDCIIGNPPYIRIQTFEEIHGNNVVNYIRNKYASAKEYNFDIYVVFIEQALNLLNNKGILGYIVMNRFFITQYGENLRRVITRENTLKEIVDFGFNQIFDGVTTYTCLLILDKNSNENVKLQVVDDLSMWEVGDKDLSFFEKASKFTSSPWYLQHDNANKIYERFKINCDQVKEVAERVFVGLQTDCDDVFILDQVHEESRYIYCKSAYTNEVHKFEKNHLKPFLKGSLDVKKYTFSNNKKWVIFPYENEGSKSNLISADRYKIEYPLTWEYLELCRERLSKRKEKGIPLNSIPGYTEWYKYIYKKNHTRFEQPKILYPAILKGATFNYDSQGIHYFVGSGAGGGGGGAILLPKDSRYSYHSLLGVLNSDVVSFQISQRGTKQSGGYFGVSKGIIDQLYIPKINSEEKKIKLGQIEKYVKQIKKTFVLLNPKGITESNRNQYKQQINVLDRKINKLVFDLYELEELEVEYIKSNID